MIMDLLMMWPLPIWISAVMRGRLHEYSEALSLGERWMLKVALEGTRGHGSRADSALKSASIISEITVNIPEESKQNASEALF